MVTHDPTSRDLRPCVRRPSTTRLGSSAECDHADRPGPARKGGMRQSNGGSPMSILRGLAIPIGSIAALLLFLLVNPWLVLAEGTLRQVLTVGFWIAFIVLLSRSLRIARTRRARKSRSRVPHSRGSCSTTGARGCSGCRSGSSSASRGSSPAGARSRTRSGRRAAPRCEPTGSAPRRSQSRVARRSRMSGIATSSIRCSTAGTKAGSPGW